MPGKLAKNLKIRAAHRLHTRKVLASVNLFVHDYYSNRLPSTFNTFFKSIDKVHQYAPRLTCRKSYYLLRARTNYRKFNIHSSGAKLLNATKKDL